MTDLPKPAEWMAGYSDSVPICDLTIPGTHDSLTATCPQRYYKTQTLELQEQLLAGVRFLDLRIRSTLVAAHREWISDIKAKDILETMRKFLREHPQEFLLVRFQNANENKDDFPQYCEQITKLIDENRDLFFLWDEQNQVSISELTLGQVRGKVLALECAPSQYRSTHLEDCVWAYPWHEAENILLQDLWDGPSLKDKKQAIAQLSEGDASGVLRLNHISATNGELGFPDAYASDLNPWISDRYANEEARCRQKPQVLIFDYVTPEIAQTLIEAGRNNCQS
ncbi:hypothetical protein [Varibaculum vaginae]|uniref:hypothetical protein n=1 Tax=Varibaculum vaginae TaxID=2364797 RepID=UPI001F2741E6|nr:hypothetical protein [Varibaculum vaginae]